MNTERIAYRLNRGALENGGATVAVDGSEISGAFMIGGQVPPLVIQLPESGSSLRIREHIEKYPEVKVWGSWEHEENLYIDAVSVFPYRTNSGAATNDRVAVLRDALDLGEYREELAIGELTETGEFIQHKV